MLITKFLNVWGFRGRLLGTVILRGGMEERGGEGRSVTKSPKPVKLNEAALPSLSAVDSDTLCPTPHLRAERRPEASVTAFPLLGPGHAGP